MPKVSVSITVDPGSGTGACHSGTGACHVFVFFLLKIFLYILRRALPEKEGEARDSNPHIPDGSQHHCWLHQRIVNAYAPKM